MAIAYGAGTDGGVGSNTTLTVASPSVTGSDKMGVVHVTTGADSGGTRLTALTWDGVSIFANLAFGQQFGTYNNYHYVFIYMAPPDGATNVVATCTGSDSISMVVEYYTGVNQSNTADASNGSRSGVGATSASVSVTTTVDNCWLVSSLCTTGTSALAGANTTLRNFETTIGQLSSGDTNAAQSPAGSYGQAYSWTTNSGYSVIGVSLAPAAASTSIKTIAGLAKASVKTAHGLAIASVKTYNGLA